MESSTEAPIKKRAARKSRSEQPGNPGSEPAASEPPAEPPARKPRKTPAKRPKPDEEPPPPVAVDASFVASLSGTLRCLQRDDRHSKIAALHIV